MARARNIKPAFFANDDLADIAPLGRLLFIGLWTVADREGRLEDRPRRVKAEVLPYDDCDIDELLNDLQAHGFITRYDINGVGYIQVLNFTKHQNPHVKETASTIPAPDSPDARTDLSDVVAGPPADEQRSESQESPMESSGSVKPHTSTIQEQCKAQPKPERAGLIPDSPSLIPDCGNQREAAPKSPPAAQSSRAPRASRLPENWKLPEEWQAWALGERPDWTPAHAKTVAEAFRDYWIGKGGADARKVNWEATWRNWVRREKDMAPRGNVMHLNRQEALEARNREAAARFARGA